MSGWAIFWIVFLLLGGYVIMCFEEDEKIPSVFWLLAIPLLPLLIVFAIAGWFTSIAAEAGMQSAGLRADGTKTFPFYVRDE